jgi:hypothetical protein
MSATVPYQMNQQTHFEKTEQAIKTTIFGTMFVLLKESNMPRWLIYISFFIEAFQVASFSFTLNV